MADGKHKFSDQKLTRLLGSTEFCGEPQSQACSNGASLLHLWQEHFRKQRLPLVASCFPGYLAERTKNLKYEVPAFIVC